MTSELPVPDAEFTNWAITELAQEKTDLLESSLQGVHPSIVGKLIESLHPDQRSDLLALLPEQAVGAALHHVSAELRNQLLNKISAPRLTQIAEYLQPNELASTLDALPDSISDSVVSSLDAENLARVNAVLEYEEGTAGRIMTTDALSIKPDITLRVVSKWLRKKDALPPYTSSLVVTDEHGVYLGKLPMSAVVTGDLDALVKSVMLVSNETIAVSASEHDVAQLFEQRHLVAAAVVDDEQRVVGRITVERAMDILQREADHQLLNSRGLSDEADLFAPIVPSALQRGVWLGINLATVFLAAWVIGQFQVALDEIVALAVLMPIVASMGGIAGSQTLTLTIRGLALDQIVRSNVRWLTTKELGVGALNGIAWAVVVALVTYLWFKNPGLSLIIATAMMINLVVAAASGVIVPLVLKRLGFDPALSGAVVLTTVTDIVGFLSFLGLASLFLL